MEEIVYMTAKGKKNLEERLAFLISSRETAADEIREAREFGDLKENAEYAAAREHQVNLEDEITLIQERLVAAKIFSYQKASTDKVNIGTKVTLNEVGGKRKQEWTITGIVENDPSNFYISNETPFAKSLLGKAVGETVELNTPAGIAKFKIASINAGE